MNDFISDFKTKITSLLSDFKKELGGIRTNRPTPAILENIRVEYYGQKLPLNQVASIAIEPPRDIVVSVWDASAIPEVVRSIE